MWVRELSRVHNIHTHCRTTWLRIDRRVQTNLTLHARCIIGHRDSQKKKNLKKPLSFFLPHITCIVCGCRAKRHVTRLFSVFSFLKTCIPCPLVVLFFYKCLTPGLLHYSTCPVQGWLHTIISDRLLISIIHGYTTTIDYSNTSRFLLYWLIQHHCFHLWRI